jgi:iron complex transport system substrate-binding protein
VALAPSNVEILFVLGLGSKVVGVGDFSTWPPEANELPKLGGLMNPNLEAIVHLQPDLLIALPSEGALTARAEALGIEVLTVPSDDLDDVAVAIEEISRRCGIAEAGQRFLAEWRRALAPRVPAGSPPPPGALRVMISIARPGGPPSEVLTAGPGSYLDELLTRLGAINVFADAPAPFPTVGLEEVLGRQPDVIVELRTQEPANAIRGAAVESELRRDWSGFPQIPAVRDGWIELLAGSHTLLPGPRLPQLYRELAWALGIDLEGDSVPTAPAAGTTEPETQ